MTIDTQSTPSIELPTLYRLALALVLREARKHPHTWLDKTLEALAGRAPVPAEAPWWYRQALKLVISESHLRPHTLMAHAIAELERAAAEGGHD